MHTMDILGIIPARGNSKGIPHKNLRKLAKIPLIQYTIESAKKSKITKIIVSTDNMQIAKLAQNLEVDVPFIRPKSLSMDNSSTFDVIQHALDFLEKNENYSPDIIVILQPTSPLRTSELIDNSIDILKQTKANSVISVSEIKTHPSSSFVYSNKFLKPFDSNFSKYVQRQQYTPLYFPTGAIYTTWKKTITKYNSIYGPKIVPLFTKNELNLDIDTPFDFFLTEATLLYWKKFETKFTKESKKLRSR